MDLRQLQYFVCLFEEGNVTRAARRLNLVQPALSMQIARLEAELGQRLFERSSQGMLPTAAGRTMYRLFLPILRDVSSARQRMANLAGKVSGHVAVGLIASVTQSVLPRSLATFAARYPDVEITVAEGYTATFIDWVTAGQLDLAVINRPRKRLGLVADHILQEEFVLVTGVSAPLDLPAPVRFQDLPRLKLVIPSKRHGLRAVLDYHAESEGIDLAPRLEVDALTSIAELVRTTDWVTVLPAIAVHKGLADGSLRAHAIVAPRIVRNLVCIHHPRRPLTPAAVKFIEALSADLTTASTGELYSGPSPVPGGAGKPGPPDPLAPPG